MDDSTSEDVPLSENDTFKVVNGLICIIVTAAVATFFPVLYKKVRCKFPVQVNCWFCNKNSKVPYNDANCWDCPHCEQYNGFNKDGGYNKDIKEQHTRTLNPLVFNSSAKPSGKGNSKKEKYASNGFCRLCNINQQLKIQQLARFVPLNEDNYDREVEHFKEQLEKSYRLCSQCEKTLTERLKNEQYNLLRDRLNVEKEKNQFSKLNGMGHPDWHLILPQLRRVLCSGLKTVSGLISFVIFLSLTFKWEKETQFFKEMLPGLFVLDFQPFLQVILNFLTYSYDVKKELVSIGLLCCALSSFCRQTNFDCPSLLIFWGIFYALTWTDMIGLEILISAVCVLLCFLEVRRSPNYTLKKLLSESNTPNVKTSEFSMLGPHELKKNVIQRKSCEKKLNLNESEEPPQLLKKSEPVVEVPKDESLRPKTLPKISLNESVTSRLRSRKIFNKNFLASLENECMEKELSPPPEIFHNLNNLHLGSSPVLTEKQPNFLFETHNFEERLKKNAQIIKPAKFTKPPTNSWTNGELHETVSRSSTPSSGYSSQRAEKADMRQSFHFPKVISPVPYARTTPPENFDYWDRSHPCFSTNNFHCFSPGCMPFQQFTNPLGHTTVYTYTRPTNYPFSFPPSSNSQSYSYSPGPHSPRFSDQSDTGNLFQTATSSFQSNQKWSAVKSVLYNISIFFNIVSTCVLAYFTWSGIITLTGN